jgi:hypothetical protein
MTGEHEQPRKGSDRRHGPRGSLALHIHDPAAVRVRCRA